MSVNHKAMMRAALFTPGQNGRWGLPLLLQGEPGAAKTSIIRQEAHRMRLPLEVLIASIREPADFLGFPSPQADGTCAYLTPAWAARVSDMGNGLVFLDELNTAPPAVQAALLRVVLEGAVGDTTMPPGIRFIAAQNAVEDAAGGWDLAPPLANRFGHIDWPAPSVESWTDFILSSEEAPAGPATVEETEREVAARWPAAWAQARGTVTAFLRQRPDLLLKKPNAGDPAASRAWPSPRSWENATRALASARVHGLDDETRDAFFAAFVGNGVTIEFVAWMTRQDLPEPLDVLDGKVDFAHDPTRLDRTAAVLGACSAMLANDKLDKREARAAKLWSILGELTTRAADLCVAPAQRLVRGKLTQSPEARKTLASLQGVLAAATAL